jgi:RsiW-degrading membrane proteinase PrsW (M82 family)
MKYAAQYLPIILPLVFWIVYHYKKYRHLPEPMDHLALAFAFGVGSFYLGMYMYQALGLVGLRYDAYVLAETNLPALFIYSVSVIGVIEELAKMVPFLLFVIHFSEFDEPLDGVVYASFIALGFALVENIQYLQFLTNGEAWARGFAGPVVHIVFASIWGYYIGRAYLCRKPLFRVILSVLICTAFLHGIYDFVVIALPAPALLITAMLIAGLWVWRLVLIRDLRLLPEGPCPSDEGAASD